MAKREIRWTVIKDYITEHGDECQDTYCIIYGTQAEAEATKTNLQNGLDKSWFDPAGSDVGFLYVDSIEIDI